MQPGVIICVKRRHVAPRNHAKPGAFVPAHGSVRAPRNGVPREVIAVATLMLAASIVACSNDERPRAAVPDPMVDAYLEGDTAPPELDSGEAPDTASDTSSVVDSIVSDAGPEIADLGPPPDAAIFERCVGSYAAYATKSLIAGGMTPKTFAAAYNAEVASLTYPGPFLLAFKGVDSADTTKWKLAVGALDTAGSDVKFFGAPAEVAYKMTAGIALTVADQATSFKLRFASSTTNAQIPIDSIAFSGAAGDCSELSVDELILTIPESAKNMPFAGKTIGELMGPALTPDGGPRFYVLELLGSEKKVTFAGGMP